MTTPRLIKGEDAFARDHPWPDQVAVTSLYKFTALDEDHPEHLQQLLSAGRLFHSLPKHFNDPWDCRPSVRVPDKGAELALFRERLVRALMRQGMAVKEAEGRVTATLADRDQMLRELQTALDETYGGIRVACFAARRDVNLLWAHYAKSHTGICLEFNASVDPFRFAQKVKYQAHYPVVDYPLPRDRRSLAPLLTKSEEWQYEQEFRLLMNPERLPPFPTDGEAATLGGSELTDVYLGARIAEDHKDQIVEWISKGPFKPALWQANISRSEFRLEFSRI